MSGRVSRWILLVVLPLVVALYLAYPPGDVTVGRERVHKKRAETAEEARDHGVEPGEWYVAERQELPGGRFLPLAMGRRDVQTRLVEQRPDGSIVQEVTTTVPGRIKLGLDLAGGTELLYELRPEEGERVGGEVPENVKEILKRRIDPTNVKQFPIRTEGEDRILIQVPRATPAEVETLKRRLERMGKLEFRLAVPRQSGQAKFERWYADAEAGVVPDGYTKTYRDDDPENDFYLVRTGEPEVTGDYLARVYADLDRYGLPAVGFQFDPIGRSRFAQTTETNQGWFLAIILDGVLRSAPQISEPIRGPGVISRPGGFSEAEVSDIVNVLQAGSLPMDIRLLQESTVGPQLGRDSIRRGLQALAVAGFLVLVFIGIYYISCGMVADAALIMNLVLLIGVLCFLGAALTLPGMAGILLTVGMAVDANVLIFERIREESAAGKGIRAALRNGYDRAFTTIVDANVTTLLTAIILYLVGTGPVKGFAVTLSFGILLSMFTALVVTRLAFETMIERGWLSEFKMFSLVGESSVGFSRIRKGAYAISVLVVLIGAAVFFGRGSELYDIDFTGGSLVQLSLAEPTPVAEIRSRLAAGGFPEAEVQGTYRGPGGGEGATRFSVRIKGAGKEKVEETIQPSIEAALTDAGIMAEGDALETAADGRSLMLTVAEPITETDLREALAGGGDPYRLRDVGSILPDREKLTERVMVGVLEVSELAEQRDVWAQVLGALGWAGLRRADYRIESATVAPSGDRMELVLDGPIQWELLAAELAEREFAGLAVTPTAEPGATFTLTGPADVVEQFQREFPAGAALQGAPLVEIDGLTVTAELAKGFSEHELRALLGKSGLSEAFVVPLDVSSGEWELVLSEDPIRERMQRMFGDLAQRSVKVTFEPAEGASPAQGQVLVNARIDPPLPLDVIEHYVEIADLGPYAPGLLVHRERYEPGTEIAELTLSMPADKAEPIKGRIAESFGEPRAVEKVVSIGPTVARELQGKALLAVIFASVIIVLYVAARFHAFRFGVAAVIALVHDIAITAGLIALADLSGVMGDVKINLASLAAFLTILGYSLNDTIVVFDRIRENMVLTGRKRVDAGLIDLSINQTLSRTVLTSLTTLAVVVVLYAMGGSVLQGLALTLIIGVVVGTYSSMFIASPILLDWAGVTLGASAFFKAVTLPIRLPFKALGWLLGARG